MIRLSRKILALALLWALPAAAQTSRRDSARVALIRGVNARDAGNNDAAITALRQGIAIDSTFVDLWLELGVTESFRRNWDASDAAYHTALRLQPNSAPARVGIARVDSWRGNFRKSEAEYQALTADPKTRIDAYNGLGFLAAAQLDPIGAKRWYAKTLALDPSNKDALDAMQRLQGETPGEYTALVERSANPGGSSTTQGQVRALYGIGRSVRYSGGFAWGVNPEDVQAIPVPGATSTTPQSTALTLGVDAPLLPRLRGALDFESLGGKGRTGTFVGAALSMEYLAHSWLLAGLRHGSASDGSSSVGFIGAARQLGKQTLTVQLFEGWAEHADANTALSATYVRELANATRFKVSGAWGLGSVPAFHRLDGEAVIAVAKGTGILVGFTDFDGGYRRRSARIGVVIRR